MDITNSPASKMHLQVSTNALTTMLSVTLSTADY